MKENILFKTVNTNGIYSCEGLDITVEEWKKVLQDSAISNKHKLWLARFYQEPEHKAGCKFMGEKFSCDKNSPNATIKNFGQSTQKILNRFEVQGTDGEKTYWVIPMKEGKYIGGYFEWTMRDELVQAMEELDMTDAEKFEKENFSWIPFYMELAENLLEYKDSRDDLLRIVYGMDNEDVNFFKDDKKNNFQDLHPFAFYGIFNRQISFKKRIKICTYLKEKLFLNSNIPSDFDGIPWVNNQNSWWGMPWSKNDASIDIKSNWEIFKLIQDEDINIEQFKSEFDFILSRGGTKKSLTMALYWIRPYDFMPLDTPSREYLKKIGINVFDEKDLNGENYLNLIQTIKSKIESNEIKEKSIPEISYNAWQKDRLSSNKINFWSGGIYWGDEKKLEEFSTNSYWQIGWEKTSDNKSAKDAWKNIRNIQIGDLLSFHGYGGKNDLTIYQISKVIGKDDDSGKLIIEKLNKDSDILFHDKAPKMENGGWFGTLFQVTGEEAINKIFGNYIQGETQMENLQDKLINETKCLLENTKNLILTGAPGTGKTYLAKLIAKAMGCTDNEIGFVQFHQSYDYTDFVEGLRPVQNDSDNQIGFERKDGVFKEFCGKALKSIFYDSNENVDNFEECWKKLVDELDENNFVIIPLISGKGDFRVELNEYGTGLANRTYENDDFQKGNWIQGKSKFFSKDQLYNIYQGLPGTPAGGHDNYRKAVIEYMKKNLGLMDYKKSETTYETKKNFVFIIDEINRGEVSKIFGELFYCVDPGYRGERGRINTQYQNLISGGEFQKGFFIPENVYIIGTMNDIDRSVESMDFAFRRRFAWKEISANDTQYMLDEVEKDGVIYGLSSDIAEEAKERMDRLNDEISKVSELNSAYHIGASYFLKLKNYEGDSDNGFQSLWNYHLKGILEEYLRGNPEKADLMKKFKAAYDGEDVTNEG